MKLSVSRFGARSSNQIRSTVNSLALSGISMILILLIMDWYGFLCFSVGKKNYPQQKLAILCYLATISNIGTRIVYRGQRN